MRSSFAVVCQRSPACRDGGRPFLPTLEKVLAEVRAKPWRGTAYDADGRRMRVRSTAPALVAVAFGATYAPAFYRELTAALRSGCRGDRRRCSGWSPRPPAAAPTPDRSAPTARGSTPPSPATTTRSSTT